MNRIRVIFIITFGLISSQSFSQINKGRVGLGGNIGFDYSKYKNDSTNSDNAKIAIQPSLTFYLSNKAALGLNLSFISETESRRTVRLTPFIKTAKKASEKFYITSRFDGDGSFGKKENGGKKTFFSLAWTPGVEYFIGNNWSASASFASVGYSYTKFTPDNSSAPEKTSTFRAALDFSSAFGLSYYFGKVK